MLTSFAGGRAGYLRWLDTTRNTHERRISIFVLTLGGDLTGVIDNDFFHDGAVDIDVTRDPTRQARLQLRDRGGRIAKWAPDSKMIQVVDERRVQQPLGDYEWVGCPVITGVISAWPDTADGLTELQLEGKERLLLGQFGRQRTWAKKTKVTDIIKAMAREAGENQLGQIPDLPNTIPSRLTVTRTQQLWKAMTKLARAIGRVLFYDGAGRLQLRRQPSQPSLVVNGQSLAGPVNVDRPDAGGPNEFIAKGKKPKGDKKRPAVRVALPRSSPLVPIREGERIHRIQEITNDKAKNRKACRKIAVERADRAKRQMTRVSFDCLAHPGIEEYDLIKVDYGGGRAVPRFTQGTIGLGTSVMSVGTKKTTVNRPLQLVTGGRGAKDAEDRRRGRAQDSTSHARLTHAHVAAITREVLGDQLTADAVSGATRLYVSNVDEFDELGGSVRIGATTYRYTTVDDGIDDNDAIIAQPSIVLAGSGLTFNVTAGTAVQVWNRRAGAVVAEWVADLVDDVDGSAWQALVDTTLVRYLSSGISGLVGDSVVIEQDEDDEWLVTRVLGKTPPAWTAA